MKRDLCPSLETELTEFKAEADRPFLPHSGTEHHATNSYENEALEKACNNPPHRLVARGEIKNPKDSCYDGPFR
jgi:hypothetical protein